MGVDGAVVLAGAICARRTSTRPVTLVDMSNNDPLQACTRVAAPSLQALDAAKPALLLGGVLGAGASAGAEAGCRAGASRAFARPGLISRSSSREKL